MKITIIERLSLQAQRMQAMTDSLAKVFGPQTLLVDNLTREVAVTLSILDQVKAEATTKVEETAAAAEPDGFTSMFDILEHIFKEMDAKADGAAAPQTEPAPETKPEAEEAMPAHVQDMADLITRTLKAQGFEVSVIPVKLPKL